MTPDEYVDALRHVDQTGQLPAGTDPDAPIRLAREPRATPPHPQDRSRATPMTDQRARELDPVWDVALDVGEPGGWIRRAMIAAGYRPRDVRQDAS